MSFVIPHHTHQDFAYEIENPFQIAESFVVCFNLCTPQLVFMKIINWEPDI